MRGQLVTMLDEVGGFLVKALLLFVVIGAIVGAGLIDNTNPFYTVWTKIVSYSNTAFTLIAVGVIIVVGLYIYRHYFNA